MGQKHTSPMSDRDYVQAFDIKQRNKPFKFPTNENNQQTKIKEQKKKEHPKNPNTVKTNALDNVSRISNRPGSWNDTSNVNRTINNTILYQHLKQYR